MQDKKYNDKGELSRVFHSLSYSLGFVSGIFVNAFQAATGKEKFYDKNNQYSSREIWTNSSLLTISWLLDVFGHTMISGPMYMIGLAGLISDACGLATGESFGAMKEGYRQERAHNTPKFAI